MSQEYEKANTAVSIILQSYQSIWMEFDMLLRLVRVMNAILILFRSFNI